MFLPNFKYRNAVKAIIVIGVIGVFVFLLFYLKDYINEKTSNRVTTATEAYLDINSVRIEDRQYVPKDGVKTVLFIGLDIDGELISSNSYNNDYNADFLMLASFNMENGTCDLVEINRDTIVDVQRTDIFGQKVDKQPMQICLSYSFGDGLGASAKNTKRAVSDIFYGMNIDYYFVLTRDATRMAVDYLGGIKVLMDNDYLDINSAYYKGAEVLMTGKEAMNFVSARYGTVAGTNTYRMQRQMCLLNSLVKELQTEDFNYNELYNVLYPYTLSDVDFAVFSRIMANIDKYKISEVVSPEGSAYYGSAHAEFYLDKDSVKKIAENLFFDLV